VRVDKWSMSAFGTRGEDRAQTYTFADLFSQYTGRITSELATALASSGQGVECSELAIASRQAFRGLVPTPPPPPPPVPLPVQPGVALSIENVACDVVNQTLGFRIENLGVESTNFKGSVEFTDRTEDRNTLGRSTFEGFIDGAVETDPVAPRVEFSEGAPDCSGTDLPIEQRGCDVFISVSGGTSHDNEGGGCEP
jgi:hypothetical protein